MPAVAEIEDALIAEAEALGQFFTVQSSGRKAIPESYSYPACFIFWDNDSEVAGQSRAIDTVDFKVVVQTANLAGESLAAQDAYAINDALRDRIRGKTLGLASITPFVCLSRRCTDYDDEDGMIEYTHTYRTKVYQAVVTS